MDKPERNLNLDLVWLFVALVLGLTLFYRNLLLGDSVCVVGDIQAKLSGAVPGRLQNRFYDAGRMHSGIGMAAIDSWNSLGDALAVGGRVYLRNTDRRSTQYYKLSSNRFFRSSHFVYLPDVLRLRTRRVELPAGRDLAQVYEFLNARAPQGSLFSGYVYMARLRGIAIAAPPIHGRPLYQNTARYYTRPMESSEAVWVYMVGMTAPPSRRWRRHDRDLVNRLLPPESRHPGRTAGLAHALRLRRPPADSTRPPLEENVETLVAMVGGSLVQEGWIEYTPWDSLRRCDD